MNNKEAKGRLISLKLSYKIRIEEEDIEALDMGAEALENQKTGQWLKSKAIDDDEEYGETDVAQCSECGFIERSEYWAREYFKYCPNCGAKMEGEENEKM